MCTDTRINEEKQYLEAMEEIEELRFEEVPTITDLYLFANLFLKAEKMDIAKELYYTVYHRTSSRPALYRLLSLRSAWETWKKPKNCIRLMKLCLG